MAERVKKTVLAKEQIITVAEYERQQAAKAAAEKMAAEKAAAEQAMAAKAAALGLLQPLEALSLDADAFRKVTAAAVTYCDAQGADSFADLVERASRLIAWPQAMPFYRLEIGVVQGGTY